MDLAEFYGAVLPPTGSYALFHGGRHKWIDTIQGLVAYTLAHKDEADWYFATGSYLKFQRKQETVVGKKCFYLDIDAGEAKFAKNPNTAWPTVRDALAAVVAFSAKVNLKPSIIVASGGGLHIYYVLDEVVSGADWTPVAEAFKRLTKEQGLKADPTSTGDSARILRPPETLHKSGARVAVVKDFGKTYTLAEFSTAVGAFGQISTDFLNVQTDVVAPADLSINDDFKTFESVPTSALKILPRCGALREVAELHGAVAEPQWRAMLGVVKHTIEGVNIIHEWSKGHPNYDPTSTYIQEKFDKYKGGPSLCETFEGYSAACSTCEHHGRIKSPIVLGRISVEDVERTPELADVLREPPPVSTNTGHGLDIPPDAIGEAYRITFENGKPTLSGQIIKFIKDPSSGETIKQVLWLKFTQDIFWLTGWTEAGQLETETSTVSWTLLRRGKTQGFELPNELSADRRALMRYLAGKTINPLNHEPDTVGMMQQYVNDQIRRVKDAASKPVVRDHLGFHMDSKGDLFCAQGEYVIYKDGTVRKATLGHGLDNVREAMMIESLPPTKENSWGPQVWKEVAIGARTQTQFYQKWFGASGMEVAQLAIMLQLASPLLVFAADTDMQPEGQLPSAGLTVSLYSSESAKGKTSIQAAASYAFGDAGAIIRQGDRLGMTFNAQVATAAALGTLPFPMDEVTTNDKSQVGESINRIASGIEKTRASKDGTVARAPLKWALISTVSTNVPQRELVSEFQKGSDALQMRLIELNCDRLPTRELGIVPEYDAALRSAMAGTKGSLGAMIHLYCVMKGYAHMRKLVLDKTAYVAKLSPGESKERFILRGVAAMLVLNDILAELGLQFFATDVLETETVLAFTGARSYSLTTTKEEPSLQFMKMVRELAPFIMITPDDISLGDDMTVLENDNVRTPVAGRLCRRTNVLYLAVDACRRWAAENQLSSSALFDEAKKEKLLLDVTPGKDVGVVVLTKGVRGVWLPRQQVWKVNATALRIADTIQSSAVVALHRPQEESSGPRAARPANQSQ